MNAKKKPYSLFYEETVINIHNALARGPRAILTTAWTEQQRRALWDMASEFEVCVLYDDQRPMAGHHAIAEIAHRRDRGGR